MISWHGEDLLAPNPTPVSNNPGLAPQTEVAEKVEDVVDLHRSVEAVEDCLIHLLDGRKWSTAVADDICMSEMEVSSEPNVWHTPKLSRDVQF